MCIYDRNAFGCGHQEWGSMKAQCTRYWQKCCIRTSHESFTHPVPGLCHSCQTRSPDEHGIANEDSIHITIRLKPSMAMERAALDTSQGRPVNPADLPTPANVTLYIAKCLKQYQQAHNLPEDSVKVSDANCTFAPKKPRTTGDLYHNQNWSPRNINWDKFPDYQAQIMLLEHQNRKRLMMARDEAEHANVTTKQPITNPSYQEANFRHYKQQDYQRQLMREALAAEKRETPSAGAQGEANAQAKPELQDPFNEEGMKNLFLENYQKQSMHLRCGNSQNMSEPRPGASDRTADVTNERLLQKQEALRRGQGLGSMGTCARVIPTTAAPPNHAATHLPDAMHVKDRSTSRLHSNCIQEYEMQLMLLEQQNKKRLFMARNEQGNIVCGSPKAQDSEQKLETARTREGQLSAQAQTSNTPLQDYQMQLMLLEQQRKRMLCQQQPDTARTGEGQLSAQAQTSNTPLQEYQMQLMLLEQMKKSQLCQKKPPVCAPSYDPETEQIMEMGSVLKSQKTSQQESDLSAPIPATTPPVVRRDADGVMWMEFRFENRGEIGLRYWTIRCDVDSVNCDKLSAGFKTENCVSPAEYDLVKGCDGDETECNNLGWALADLNPSLRNNRILLKRAVDCYRMSIDQVVQPACESEEDTTMWSTDECDEWSNSGDDMETVEKDDV